MAVSILTTTTNSLLVLLAALLGVDAGHRLLMISEGQRYVVTEGETLVLVCDFQADHYNLFDYPVLWRKSQHHEDHQINIMGNLNAPFVGTKRFTVAYEENTPVHRLELIIRDVSAVDSGNYTCEIRGMRSVILASVTHFVYVRAPVQSLILTAGNSSGDPYTLYDETRHTRRTTMIENTLNPLRCTAQGGFPAPDLTMKLGKVDITPQFHYSSRPLLTGEPGLQVITYTTEIWTDSFIPTSADDGLRLKCEAAVTGLKPNVTGLKLDVHYAPKISCTPLSVPVWERNAVLQCEVWAKPHFTNLVWILDENGTNIAEGDRYAEFWILNTERSESHFDSQLFMRQAKPENFRTYTIVAENSVAAATQQVNLTQKFRIPDRVPASNQEKHRRKSEFNTYVAFSRGHSFVWRHTTISRHLYLGILSLSGVYLLCCWW